MKQLFFIVATILATCLTGCLFTTAKQQTLESVTKGFTDAVTASTDTLEIEIKNKPAVRRDEALERFLRNPNDETNFTPATGEPRAFARYVCAGTGALYKEKAALGFARTYAATCQGIVKPGGDTFAEQWKKYMELQKPAASLVSPEPETGKAKTSEDLFNDCVEELANAKTGLLAFNGVAASDTSDEVAFAAVPAAIAAYQAFYDALKKAATDGLKVVNQVQARRKFTEYVKATHQHFQALVGSDLSSDRLKDAWTRRKAHALWAPYVTFTRIVELRTANAPQFEIKELAIKLRTELAEYDALRGTGSPDRIVKSLSAAEDAVYQAATDERVSLDAIVSFLQAVASDAKAMKNDYQDLQKKTSEAYSASVAVLK